MDDPRGGQPDGASVLDHVTANILAIDAALRSECEGHPVDEVIEVIRATWAANGVHLGSDDALRSYAESVSSGTAFELAAEQD